jgi:toxin secretion/phage lysis holin
MGGSDMKQIAANSSFAFVGSIGAYLFGEWSQMLMLFFFVIIMDYLTGVMAAVVEKNLSSAIGYKGLIKKFGMVLVVALAHQLDQFTGQSVIMTGAIFFFIANELVSITENYGRIGLPLPPQLKNVIKILREKQ